jgi:hypothetical protein
MNFFGCQTCQVKAAVLKCQDCAKKNLNKCFFCYECFKIVHDDIKSKGETQHKTHKLSYQEMKQLMNSPYDAHTIVPLNVSAGPINNRSRLYIKGQNVSDVKSEYQKVKENVKFDCLKFNF